MNHKYNDTNNIHSLIGDLKSADGLNRRIVKVLIAVYILFIPAMLYLYLSLSEMYLAEKIGLSLILIGASIVLYTALKINKENNFIDYGLPTIVMLKKAIIRHQFIHPRAKPVFLGALFIMIGSSFSHLGADLSNPDIHAFLLQIPFFICAVLFGFAVGGAIWLKRQKPVRDRAKQLLLELEEI